MQRIGNLVHADFRFAMPLSALCTSALPHTLPFGYTFSRTMHHTSSQKGLRSGWQSGASEPHLLTRRCSDRRKFCGLSAPIAYATSGIFCKEAGAMVAAGQVIDYANVIRSTISSAKSAQAQEVLRCDYSIFLHLKAQDIYKKSKQSAPSVLQINQSV